MKELRNIKLIMWDNDGTIMGSSSPNDTSTKSKVILPGIRDFLKKTDAMNVICTGFKSEESERQNFDPEAVLLKLENIMNALPFLMAACSPTIGGIESFMSIKNGKKYTRIAIHTLDEFKLYIGQFKKPGVGMLAALYKFSKEIKPTLQKKEVLFIGDTNHDEQAAKNFGISFMHASKIHNGEV